LNMDEETFATCKQNKISKGHLAMAACLLGTSLSQFDEGC
jgi:hypothetical protein